MGGILRITRSDRQSGFSLIEALVSMALMGVVIYFAQSQLKLNFMFSKQTTDRQDLIKISHDIERQIDCAKANIITCSPGSRVEIPGKTGVLIRTDEKSVFKGWNLRAECSAGNSFIIRAAKFDRSGKRFEKDGLTGKLLDWDNKNGVLFNEGMLCGASSTPPAPPADLDVVIIAGPSCVVNAMADLPCAASAPPECLDGYTSTGVTLDTFGGSDSNVINDVFGQRWIRYCVKKIAK